MLDVVGKPKPPRVVMEIDPKEMTIPGKKDIRLKCKIAGFPPPAIKWFRDGNEIKVIWDFDFLGNICECQFFHIYFTYNILI